MRVVILASSLYSETACATAVRLAELGYVPVGALSLTTFDRATLLRKFGQWGVRRAARYAQGKLTPQRNGGLRRVSNRCLQPLLQRGDGVFRSLREVAAHYGFPAAVCKDQNAPDSIARLKNWAPDLITFTGGNILRQPLLDVPRLGVLNVHLGLLPEIRGMSSPEWSLLKGLPVGITIHSIDVGIDTGPILSRCEFPGACQCESLNDLRDHLIAFGIDRLGEVVSALDRGAISATPQSGMKEDHQFFVMHEWLQARAADRLAHGRPSVERRSANG